MLLGHSPVFPVSNTRTLAQSRTHTAHTYSLTNSRSCFRRSQKEENLFCMHIFVNECVCMRVQARVWKMLNCRGAANARQTLAKNAHQRQLQQQQLHAYMNTSRYTSHAYTYVYT